MSNYAKEEKIKYTHILNNLKLLNSLPKLKFGIGKQMDSDYKWLR